MGCVPAPACRAALDQATWLWPNRSRASDGICASASHSSQNSTSDHEDGTAFDLTHDPANGCDAHSLARELVIRDDYRVKYVISNGRIWSRGRSSEGWRIYTGSNPHNKHIHVSLTDTQKAFNDTSQWWGGTMFTVTWDGKTWNFTDMLIDEQTGLAWGLEAHGGIITQPGQTRFFESYPKGNEEGWRAMRLIPYRGGYAFINNRGQTYHFPDPTWLPSGSRVNEEAILSRTIIEIRRRLEK